MLENALQNQLLVWVLKYSAKKCKERCSTNIVFLMDSFEMFHLNETFHWNVIKYSGTVFDPTVYSGNVVKYSGIVDIFCVIKMPGGNLWSVTKMGTKKFLAQESPFPLFWGRLCALIKP